jgi:membrane protease YdiL (CAAX protease family)
VTVRDIPAALWLALVLVVVPWLSFRQARMVARMATAGPGNAGATARLRIYRLSVLSQAQLLLITVLLDWIDRWAVVRKALAFPRGGILWIAGCVAAHQLVALATMLGRRLRGAPLEAGTVRLLPRDARELAGFALLALMAGINEEFMYRGFAPDHLFRWGLPLWLAVAVVTLSFGLAHGYKSLAGMLRTMLIGLVAAVPVLVTGTLLPSIIAHALMDLLAGANTLPLARRLGVAIPEPQPAAVSAGPAAG